MVDNGDLRRLGMEMKVEGGMDPMVMIIDIT